MATNPKLVEWEETRELAFIWMEITKSCNLRCTHCYLDAGPWQQVEGTMTLEDWKTAIAEAAHLGCKRVQFIGGEPTLHPHLPAMIETAREVGFDVVELFTNCTRMDENLVACLSANQVTVASSLYSADPRIHDQVTRTPGSWQLTVSGFQRLLSNSLQIRVSVVEMPANQETIHKTLSLLKSLGINHVRRDMVRPAGRANHHDTSGPSSPMAHLCGQCWKGRLCVSCNREVYPCVFSRGFPVGDVTNGLGPIVRGPALRQFRTQHRQLHIDRSAEASCDPEELCTPDVSCNPPPQCQPDMCPPDL